MNVTDQGDSIFIANVFEKFHIKNNDYLEVPESVRPAAKDLIENV